MTRRLRVLLLAGGLALSTAAPGEAAEAPTVTAATTGTQVVPETLLAGGWSVRDGGRRARLVVAGRSDLATSSRYRARWLSDWVQPGPRGTLVAAVEECTSVAGAAGGTMQHVVRFRTQSVRGPWSAWSELRTGYPAGPRSTVEPGHRVTQNSFTFAGGRGPLRVEVQVLGVVTDRVEDVLLGVAVDVLPSTGTVHAPGCRLPRE